MNKIIIIITSFLLIAIIYHWYLYSIKEIECSKTTEIYHNQEFVWLVSWIYIQWECINLINL